MTTGSGRAEGRSEQTKTPAQNRIYRERTDVVCGDTLVVGSPVRGHRKSPCSETPEDRYFESYFSDKVYTLP